jgi:drug/metabolite transporter (DMT)-like permease
LPLAWLFLGRFPDGRQLLGGSVILAGAFWLFLIHWRLEQRQLEPGNPVGP